MNIVCLRQVQFVQQFQNFLNMVNVNTFYGFLFAILTAILIYVLVKRNFKGGKEYGEYTEQEDFRDDGDDRASKQGEQSSKDNIRWDKEVSKISYTDDFSKYYSPKRAEGEIIFIK